MKTTPTPPTFTSPDRVQLPLTVYYDHSCKLCRSEIEHLAARDTHGALNMVDCSGADFDASSLPFDQTTLMGCIHAIDSQGHWLKATDVFVVCYRAANLQAIAHAFSLGKPLAERMYPWIVRNRYALSKLGVHKLFNALTHRATLRLAKQAASLSASCKNGACDVPTHTNATQK